MDRPTKQTYIADARLKKELKKKYAPIKPQVWKRNYPEARGANVSVRK